MESLDHAGEDYANRNTAEARVELGRVVLAVRTAVEEVGHVRELLSPEDRAAIEAALAEADAAMTAEAGADRLNKARTGLEKISEPFARRRMERALLAGMSGKSLHDIETALADESALQEKRAGHSPELVEPKEP